MNSDWVPGTKIPELKESNLLAEGSHSRVYSISDRLVVRQLKSFSGTYPNADLIAHLKKMGYPTPALYEARQDKLVMERVHGPTLLQSLIAQETSLSEGIDIIVDLHEQLHAINPPEITSISGWAGHGDRIIHMDIHPGTIVMTNTGPQLVSWEDSQYGLAELDVASTALVFAMVATYPGELQKPAAALFHKFTRRVGTDYVPYLEQAAQIRRTDMDTSTEELELLTTGLAWAQENHSSVKSNLSR